MPLNLNLQTAQARTRMSLKRSKGFQLSTYCFWMVLAGATVCLFVLYSKYKYKPNSGSGFLQHAVGPNQRIKAFQDEDIISNHLKKVPKTSFKIQVDSRKNKNQDHNQLNEEFDSALHARFQLKHATKVYEIQKPPKSKSDSTTFLSRSELNLNRRPVILNSDPNVKALFLPQAQVKVTTTEMNESKSGIISEFESILKLELKMDDPKLLEFIRREYMWPPHANINALKKRKKTITSISKSNLTLPLALNWTLTTNDSAKPNGNENYNVSNKSPRPKTETETTLIPVLTNESNLNRQIDPPNMNTRLKNISDGSQNSMPKLVKSDLGLIQNQNHNQSKAEINNRGLVVSSLQSNSGQNNATYSTTNKVILKRNKRTKRKKDEKLPSYFVVHDILKNKARLKILRNSKRKGLFVEASANNGLYMSDTLLLERYYNWTGLLIEPDPKPFDSLKSAKRNSWLANVCISTKNKIQQVKLSDYFKNWSRFRSYDVSSHCFPLHSLILSSVINRTKTKIKTKTLRTKTKNANATTGAKIKLPMSMMEMAGKTENQNQPQMFHIDYLSLNIEGLDLHLKILKTFPFNSFKISVISIALDYFTPSFVSRPKFIPADLTIPSKEEEMKNMEELNLLMKTNNYSMVSTLRGSVQHYLIYAHNSI